MNSVEYKCALVTGASSGIGLAYCYELAKQGINLVIVSRQREVLEALSSELQEQYSIEVIPFAIDLSQPSSPKQLVTEIQNQGITIDLLINNAGRADTGAFLDASWDEHADLIQLMLTSLTQLCYLLLPQLLSQPRASIINVSSITGMMNLTLNGRMHRMLYRPIKTYVIAFSEQLDRSYRDQGLKVQALCPGLTVSRFHERSGDHQLKSSTPTWMWNTAESVVRTSWLALRKSRRTCVVPGFHNRALLAVSRLTALFK
jgi:uncharacterized protein